MADPRYGGSFFAMAALRYGRPLPYRDVASRGTGVNGQTTDGQT